MEPVVAGSSQSTFELVVREQVDPGPGEVLVQVIDQARFKTQAQIQVQIFVVIPYRLELQQVRWLRNGSTLVTLASIHRLRSYLLRQTDNRFDHSVRVDCQAKIVDFVHVHVFVRFPPIVASHQINALQMSVVNASAQIRQHTRGGGVHMTSMHAPIQLETVYPPRQCA